MLLAQVSFIDAVHMEVIWPLLSDMCIPDRRGCFTETPKTVTRSLCDDCGLVTDFLAGHVFLCAVCFRKMRMISRNSVCSGQRCYESYCRHLSLMQAAGGALQLQHPKPYTEVVKSPSALSGAMSSATCPPGIGCSQQQSVYLPSEAPHISCRYNDASILLQPMQSVVKTDYAAFVSLPSPSPLPWTQSAGTRQQIADLLTVIEALVSEVSTLKAGILGLQEQLRLLTFPSPPKGCLESAPSTGSLLVKA